MPGSMFQSNPLPQKLHVPGLTVRFTVTVLVRFLPGHMFRTIHTALVAHFLCKHQQYLR